MKALKPRCPSKTLAEVPYLYAFVPLQHTLHTLSTCFAQIWHLDLALHGILFIICECTQSRPSAVWHWWMGHSSWWPLSFCRRGCSMRRCLAHQLGFHAGYDFRRIGAFCIDCFWFKGCLRWLIDCLLQATDMRMVLCHRFWLHPGYSQTIHVDCVTV